MSDQLSADDQRTAALIATAQSLGSVNQLTARSPRPSRARAYVGTGAAVAVALAGGAFALMRSGEGKTATSVPSSAVTKPTVGSSATTPAATTLALTTTTAAVVAPTLPPPSITIPPPPAAAADTPAPAAVSLAAAAPLTAEQKGELLVLSGSVASEDVHKAVLTQVYGFADKTKVRDQMYIATDSAPPSGTFNLLIRDGLQFESDQAKFTGVTATLALDSLAQVIKSRPNAKVRIEGHTDSAGDEAHNITLARERIAAAVAYLVTKGVDASAIEQVAVGEAKPIADNATPEGKRANRRLEVTIKGLLT
jgi:outer membrane protein OmpA-like peptidoglycan-associated protein